MIEKIKKKITLENLMCFFVILCPILDIISFLFMRDTLEENVMVS